MHLELVLSEREVPAIELELALMELVLPQKYLELVLIERELPTIELELASSDLFLYLIEK